MKPRVAERDGSPRDTPAHALAGDRPRNAPAASSSSAARLGAGDDRLGQRMLARPARGSAASASSVVLVEARERHDVGRAPACPRSACRSCRRSACRRDASRSSASALRISTPACAPRPVATMIEIGVARPERAGAGDDQHATPPRPARRRATARAQRPARRRTRPPRPAPPPARTRPRPRRPAPGSARGCAAPRPPWRRSARACVSAPTLARLHDEAAGPVERAAGHGRARGLLDRHRLAGQHRLVDGDSAFDHHAVDRHGLAGAHAQPVADLDGVERHLGLRGRPRRSGARSWAPGRAARGSRRRSARAPAAPAPGRAAPAR